MCRMAAKHPDRKIPRPATRPLETLTKIAAQNLDGYLFSTYLLSRTVVRGRLYEETTEEAEVIQPDPAEDAPQGTDNDTEEAAA